MRYKVLLLTLLLAICAVPILTQARVRDDWAYGQLAFKFRIIDDNGDPLEGATVRYQVSHLNDEGNPTVSYGTVPGASSSKVTWNLTWRHTFKYVGTADIKLWVRRDGYETKVLNYKMSRDNTLLNKTVTVTLDKETDLTIEIEDTQSRDMRDFEDVRRQVDSLRAELEQMRDSQRKLRRAILDLKDRVEKNEIKQEELVSTLGVISQKVNLVEQKN